MFCRKSVVIFWPGIDLIFVKVPALHPSVVGVPRELFPSELFGIFHQGVDRNFGDGSRRDLIGDEHLSVGLKVRNYHIWPGEVVGLGMEGDGGTECLDLAICVVRFALTETFDLVTCYLELICVDRIWKRSKKEGKRS